MTEPFRKAIEKLGHELSVYPWELEHARIVYAAIEDTAGHAELTFCPLAMAAYHEGERIDEVLQDPDHREFAEWVNQKRAGIREHLEAESGYTEPEDTKALDRDATLCAAAAVVNDSPQSIERRPLLELDEDTVKDIIHAADDAHYLRQ